VRANVEPTRDINQQGAFAGPVTRAVAYAIDGATLAGVFSLASAAVVWMLGVFVGHTVDVTDGNLLVMILFWIWAFLYFWLPWATSGKTFGMALAGIRVVRGDGTALPPGRAAIRTLVLPISFVVFGLGLVGIVVGKRHRAWHDMAADSVVVYAWDAKAARLRFLAKEQAVPGPGAPGR
jgi:uncharacterized RDD family membrane protein YckC